MERFYMMINQLKLNKIKITLILIKYRIYRIII